MNEAPYNHQELALRALLPCTHLMTNQDPRSGTFRYVVWIRYGFYIPIRADEIGVLRDGSYYDS